MLPQPSAGISCLHSGKDRNMAWPSNTGLVPTGGVCPSASGAPPNPPTPDSGAMEQCSQGTPADFIYLWRQALAFIPLDETTRYQFFMPGSTAAAPGWVFDAVSINQWAQMFHMTRNVFSPWPSTSVPSCSIR